MIGAKRWDIEASITEIVVGEFGTLSEHILNVHLPEVYQRITEVEENCPYFFYHSVVKSSKVAVFARPYTDNVYFAIVAISRVGESMRQLFRILAIFNYTQVLLARLARRILEL